jgi:hypothetical protein
MKTRNLLLALLFVLISAIPVILFAQVDGDDLGVLEFTYVESDELPLGYKVFPNSVTFSSGQTWFGIVKSELGYSERPDSALVIANKLKDWYPNPRVGWSYRVPSYLELFPPATQVRQVESEQLYVDYPDFNQAVSIQSLVRQPMNYLDWEQGIWHVVQPGESYRSIASDYGCPTEWVSICDSALHFENGHLRRHVLHPNDTIFVPPMYPYEDLNRGIIKVYVNRGMTMYMLRQWVRQTYGTTAEVTFVFAAATYESSRQEFEWRDIPTTEILTIYTSWEAFYAANPRKAKAVQGNYAATPAWLWR